MRQLVRFISLPALALVFVGCGSSSKKETADPKADRKLASNATLAEVGLDPTAMDTTVSPCDDFFQYACGNWIARTEIPSDEAAWARSFSVIDEENKLVLRDILDKAAKDPAGAERNAKIGPYWAACMDEKAVEAAGVKSIEPLLRVARAVKDRKSLMSAVIALHRHRIWPLWDLSAEQDFKNASMVMAFIDQNGLGLPDRDFYLEEARKPLRDMYAAHVQRMLALLGLDAKAAAQAAADVMEIETELAKVSKSRVERRDPESLYNKMDRAGLKKMSSGIDWDRYLKELGLAKAGDAIVTAPAFFDRTSQLIGTVKPAKWRNYFLWHVVSARAMDLSRAFVDEKFKFEQAITGIKELPPRWKRCVEATNGALGELVGESYVEVRFAGQSREAAQEMVGAIKAAFGQNLEQLAWMDAGTRARANEKMQAMVFKIGYPEKSRAYEFAIGEAYAANQLAAAAWEMKRQMTKIGKPVDREEWRMSPATVNASYNPLVNEMTFPAGILQPPFYSAKNAVAVNLGAIGMVVGHELTHGFDDEGSKFAADGNMSNWWDPEVGKKFHDKTQCVVKQYSAYEPLPGVHLNGALTQGENIADIGGLKMAFRAYRALRAGQPPIVADGLTEDQLFFLAHGQAWCGKYTEELQKLLVTVDPHSPPRFRVNGPVSSLPEFASAFSCQAAAPMNPAARCEVW